LNAAPSFIGGVDSRSTLPFLEGCGPLYWQDSSESHTASLVVPEIQVSVGDGSRKYQWSLDCSDSAKRVFVGHLAIDINAALRTDVKRERLPEITVRRQRLSGYVGCDANLRYGVGEPDRLNQRLSWKIEIYDHLISGMTLDRCF
jgi:hypothetical protein